MAIYLLDGRRCPALFLSGTNPDGTPLRAVYWYYSTEGNVGVEQRETDQLVPVPDDNGASWGPGNYPTGANFYLIVPDDANLQEVSNRLGEAYNNRQRAAETALGGSTTGAPAPGVTDVFLTPETTPQAQQPRWQELGFASKEAWRKAGKP